MAVRVTFQFKDQNIQQSMSVELPSHMSLTLQYQLCKDRVCRYFHKKESDVIFVGIAPIYDEEKDYCEQFTRRDFVRDKHTIVNISAEIPDRWVNHFCSMLDMMEHLGNIGSSRVVGIVSDGDGDFRPKFTFGVNHEDVEPHSSNIDESPICDILYDAG